VFLVIVQQRQFQIQQGILKTQADMIPMKIAAGKDQGISTPNLKTPKRSSQVQKEILAGIILFLPLIFSSCAVKYFDTETQTEHLWGIGHFKMKVTPPNEGLKTVVTGSEIIGLGLGLGQENYYLGLGWDQRALIQILDPDICLRIEWPQSNPDFFSTRIGGAPPFLESLPQECR